LVYDQFSYLTIENGEFKEGKKFIRKKVFGNIEEEPLETIFLKPDFVKFREKVRATRIIQARAKVSGATAITPARARAKVKVAAAMPAKAKAKGKGPAIDRLVGTRERKADGGTSTLQAGTTSRTRRRPSGTGTCRESETGLVGRPMREA